MTNSNCQNIPGCVAFHWSTVNLLELNFLKKFNCMCSFASMYVCVASYVSDGCRGQKEHWMPWNCKLHMVTSCDVLGTNPGALMPPQGLWPYRKPTLSFTANGCEQLLCYKWDSVPNDTAIHAGVGLTCVCLHRSYPCSHTYLLSVQLLCCVH